MFILVIVATMLAAFSASELKSSEKSINKEMQNFEYISMAANTSLFYDLKTKQPLKKIVQLSALESESTKQSPFTSPCTCEAFQCSCCAGIRIHGFGFDRQACAELTYVPTEALLNLEFKMNNASVYKSRLSTHNRQVCIPIMPVTLIGPFDVCLRLYDMTVVGQRLHACLAMLGRVSQYPVLILQFNCMEMGAGGVGLARPIGGNYNESSSYPDNTGHDKNKTSTLQPPQQDSETYDSVTESA